MGTDFYTLTSGICDALDREGLASDAESLRSAMALTGSVNEILMRIRWHLRRVRRANKVSSATTRRAVHDLLRELDDALG